MHNCHKKQVNKQCYDDASINHDNANMEVKLARGTHTTLNDRLDKSDEIQAQTNAQLSQKASKEELAVERTRIDLLTKIENGQTDGNTELLDIRVGVDGIEYDTAGVAVREQIGDLKSDSSELRETVFGEVPLSLVINEYVSNNGSFVKFNGWARTNYIDISNLETLTIRNDGIATPYNAFYDSSHAFVGMFNVEFGENTITIPSNAVYIVVSNETSFMNKIKVFTGKSFDEKINNLSTTINNIPIKISKNLLNTANLIDGYYVDKKTGNLIAYTNWCASDYIPVIVDIYVTIISNNNMWAYSPTVYFAFYDSDKKYTHGDSVSPSSPNISAKSGDAYVRISFDKKLNITPMFGIKTDFVGYIDTENEFVPFGNELEHDKHYAELKSEIESVSKKVPSSPKIVMSDYVVGLVGEEFDIHYDNVLYGFDAKLATYKEVFGGAPCIGMENLIRFNGKEVGDTTGAFFIGQTGIMLSSKEESDIVAKKSFTYKTISKDSGSGITRNVLLIGDSWTAPGLYARELKNLFDDENEPMNINLLGTLGNGGAEVGASDGYHEGHGGWSSKTFCTTDNYNGYTSHFYNPTTKTFDFSYYMNYTGYTKIDDVFINLGINDVATISDYDEIIGYYNVMIDSIRGANSSGGQPAKIFIGLCGLPAKYEYSSVHNNCQRSKALRLAFHERLMKEYGGRESEGFFIVPLHLSIDSCYDFKIEEKARSFRDTSLVPYCTDNVHPSNIAYNKVADRIRTYIKYAEIV